MMPSTLQISQLSEYMSRHVADVFSTLLYLPTGLSEQKVVPQLPARVSCCVGFAGENTAGVVYVHYSESFTRCATAAMLGLGPDDSISQTQINHVIGEVVNMLTGGLKAWLCASGRPCAMSIPTIIRGKSFLLESLPDVEQVTLIFECAGDQVVVEIHAKLG